MKFGQGASGRTVSSPLPECEDSIYDKPFVA